MSTTRNIIFPLIAALALMLAGCRHDSATMHELALIDSMIYHQSEREACALALRNFFVRFDIIPGAYAPRLANRLSFLAYALYRK